MALIAAHLDAGIIHLGGDSVYSNMPEFCDEDDWTPVAMENMQKDIKSSRAIFWKWLPLCLATWNDHKLQYFLDDSLHLNTKIITRICSFQNCIYLKIAKIVLALVLGEWVT